ncbi:hypothetical protein WH52_12280 [Tenacibaculum holothuriorum]|uniref:Signal transduction histidine kinase internal region domain-containing protein n=1 Tax=Tenacibaculum holothuriorum TaxID=1635173 RepID=A0A1Y2P9V8_9FLAO|nr:histidine kinase [Tenacibaculum holothuriorum]OSY87233.1 hypothetical protein WH52_12280 [Tenacibaculum holothuriorum]
MAILSKYKLEVPKKYVFISALLFSFAVILQVVNAEPEINALVYIRHITLFTAVYLFWALTIDYLCGVVKPFDENKPKFTQFLERFISATILVLLNLIVTNVLYYTILIIFTNFTFAEVYDDFSPYLLKSILIRFLDVIIIGAVLKIIEAYQIVQKQKLKVVSLENKLHLSQLEALRNQLDPHFLFNTLHTLNTLIGYDDKKARSMVVKVTNLLRKILDKREKHLITFEEELEYFTSYLDIEEERFHDRLEVTIDVEDRTLSVMVPTLILQPLIENAFKHGISQIEDKGKISLEVKLQERFLVINLSNSIPKKNHSSVINSTRVGLTNLQSRLQQVYGDDFKFSTKKKNDMFSVTIKINEIQKV